MNAEASATGHVLHEEILPGGGHRSFVLRRGQTLSITDLHGGGNASLLLLNADEPSDRLNLPDTLKGQYTYRLTRGHCLYSDMGRVLAAITADTCGWHDALGGVLDAEEVALKYGPGPFGTLRNARHCNGHDNLLVELGKHDLGLEDLLMVVNLFSRVVVEADGALRHVPGNSQAGDRIELHAPMNTLVVMTALQHPLDPDPVYAPRPLQLTVRTGLPHELATCRAFRPENARALDNTERCFL